MISGSDCHLESGMDLPGNTAAGSCHVLASNILSAHWKGDVNGVLAHRMR